MAKLIIGDTITLNDGEQLICRTFADLRYSSNRENGVTNKKMGPQSNEFTDLNGIGGELAFSLLLNVSFDMSIEPRQGGEDCTSHNGKKIDVKTTKYPNGMLLATLSTDPGDSDYHALMTGWFPTYTFQGYCETSKLIDDSNRVDLGRGEGYGVTQQQLRS